MFCPNCNTENRDGAKFCNECGKPLTPVEIEEETTAVIEDATAVAEAAEVSDGAGVVDEAPAADDMDSRGDEAEAQPLHGEGCEDGATAADVQVEPEGFEETGDAQATDGRVEGVAGDSAPEAAREHAAGSDAARTQVIPSRIDQAAFEAGATVAINADLSGLDTSDVYGESILDANYREPVVDFRDGGTMRMPRVEGAEPRKSTDFLTSSSKEKKHTGRWVAIAVVVVAIVIAAIVFATYQIQLWGGKAIPDVVGMTEADATQMLEDAGFSVRSTQVKSDDTEGLVLVMDPSAATRAEEGAEVVIHLATARIVPSAVGKMQADVEAACAQEGFENVSVVQEPSDEPAGTVLAIDPAEGTHAKAGQAISMTVARPRVVPAVEGMLLEDAQAAIASEGLESYVTFVNTEVYPEGQIMGTDPIAGSEVKADQPIAILIARARGQELIGLTQAMLYPGATVTIGMYSFEIQSLDSVEYLGNDTVAYSATARPFTTILGETVYVSARTIAGQIVWTKDNTVASMT